MSEYDRDSYDTDTRPQGVCESCGVYGHTSEFAGDSPVSECCGAPLHLHRLWCVVILLELTSGRYRHDYHTHADGRTKLFAARSDAAGACDVLGTHDWVKWSGYYEVSNDGLPADPRELLRSKRESIGMSMSPPW